MKCDLCNRDKLTAKELMIHRKYFHTKQHQDQSQKALAGTCPECSSPLYHEEGCENCYACGYSRCG